MVLTCRGLFFVNNTRHGDSSTQVPSKGATPPAVPLNEVGRSRSSLSRRQVKPSSSWETPRHTFTNHEMQTRSPSCPRGFLTGRQTAA